MRTLYTSLIIGAAIISSIGEIHAQWCVPTSLIPYSADMPGITRFQLNTIDRTSADLENYPNNSYVHTGLSTDLVAGQTYPITIQFTVHQLICPDMNLRIWIDLNHDGQLDDAGETLLSVDHVLPNTYTGSITIPENAMLGSTRLRVTAKMSNLGGHSLPTPCDFPADDLGYHGEMEDYDVNILSATSVSEHLNIMHSAQVIYADRPMLRYHLAEDAMVGITIFDAAGSIVEEMAPLRSMHGRNDHELPLLTAGMYFVQLRMERTVLTLPYVCGR